MFGIPAVLIFGLLAFLAWRRGHRHGLVLLWGVLFGVFLGGTAASAVHSVAAGMLSGTEQGIHGVMSGVSQAAR